MDRTVIEYSSEYDPTKSSTTPSLSPRTQPLCLAITATSDSRFHLLVGTRAGTVNLLREPSPIPTGKDSQITQLDLVRFVSFGDSPIEDVLLLSEIDRLLVLSGGCLFFIDQGLSGTVQRVSGVKGVTSVSRRLRFGDTASEDPLGDIAVWCEAARPKTGILRRLGRANGAKARGVDVQRNGGSGGGCFVAASMFVKGVVLMELTIGADGIVSLASREIPGVGSVKCMIWFDDSIIFGTSEGYVLFSIGSGEITPIFSLPDLSGPPKMKALSRSKEVLLMVDNVGIVVNGNGQPVGGSLVFSCMPESITVMSHYVVSLEDDRLKLYRKKTGTCMQAIPFSKIGSGPCVMACDELGSGEVIAVTTPYKIICFRKIYVEEQIKDLLRKKYYKDAVCLVEELKFENEMTKEMFSFVHAQVGFLLLFDLHFEDAINHFLLSESMQPSEIFPFIMQDPNRWSHLVPRKRYWGLHPPPMLLEKVVDDGLLAIQRTMFLKRAGVPTTMDEDYILNPPSRVVLLESAIKNMTRYFLVCRDRDLTASLKEGVDTLLMYLYRDLNLVDDMEQLASSTNSCVVEELENLLDDSGHLRTLAFLYASKGRNSKALAIWKLLARNYSSGLWKDPKATVQNNLHSSTNIISCQRSAALEASKLLEESSDQELVLQHLRWIADEDQELAVRVLTSSKRVNQLSHGEVLATIDPRKIEIHQRYLQWLIDYERSDDTQFHTMYAVSLAKSAIQAIEMDMDIEDNIDMKCNSVLENGEDSVNSIRQRMQFFLQSSDLYDSQEVLHLIKNSELWMEKAILYKKLGQETRVLQILALKLEDSEAAQQYCAEIGRHDAYMQLLDMYLDPQNGKEPMFNAAVQLLHNHGESLDPLQVLEKLSPDMPLKHASETILRIVRARVHHYREGQVLYNLSSALNLEAQMARQEERSRHVQINDESICSSCHTRLGTKLLAMYPDDTVVCYKCYRRQGESTSESGRNFKHDILFKPGWLVTRP